MLLNYEPYIQKAQDFSRLLIRFMKKNKWTKFQAAFVSGVFTDCTFH